MSTLLTKRALFTTAATASAAGALYHTYFSSRPSAAVAQKMPPAYEATFSVPLKCDGCIQDISSALAKLPGKLLYALALSNRTRDLIT